MKDKQTQMWIPLYVDKWIFGSMRIELDPPERSVFIDLLVLGAKDNGYIRANETTPYLEIQLAGLLNISIELLRSTIKKCIEYSKIVECSPGIYRLCSWETYQFTDRYKRKLGCSSEKTEQVGQNPAPIIEDKIEKNKIEQYHTSFSVFWKAYPKKVGKGAAMMAWAKKKPPTDLCLKALEWQIKSPQWTKDNGQYIPLPSTYINQARWEDVPNTHKIVVCSVCGKEGIVHKTQSDKAICKECKYAA